MSGPGGRPSTLSRAHAILAVDDEVAITRLLRDLLERLPDTVVFEAPSGKAALDVVRSRPLDLIITDQNMPGMSGLEFLAAIDEIKPEIPRLMLTARQDLGLAVEAVNDLGVAGFFPKPIDTERFMTTVRRILARRDAEQMREDGFNQAAQAFQRAAANRGEKVRPRPFIGSLTEPRDRRRPEPGDDE